jgi:hypothetical protein
MALGAALTRSYDLGHLAEFPATRSIPTFDFTPIMAEPKAGQVAMTPALDTST